MDIPSTDFLLQRYPFRLHCRKPVLLLFPEIRPFNRSVAAAAVWRRRAVAERERERRSFRGSHESPRTLRDAPMTLPIFFEA